MNFFSEACRVSPEDDYCKRSIFVDRPFFGSSLQKSQISCGNESHEMVHVHTFMGVLTISANIGGGVLVA
jgi:hypothetical protein